MSFFGGPLLGLLQESWMPRMEYSELSVDCICSVEKEYYKCQALLISKCFKCTKFGHILMLSVWAFSMIEIIVFLNFPKSKRIPKYCPKKPCQQYSYCSNVFFLLPLPAFHKHTIIVSNIRIFLWETKVIWVKHYTEKVSVQTQTFKKLLASKQCLPSDNFSNKQQCLFHT